MALRRRTLLKAGALASPLGLAACHGAGPLQIAGNPPLQRIGWVSCIDPSKPQPLWDSVAAARPDLLLFGGDNVYYASRDWQRSALDAAYAQQAAVPGFARLRQQVPHLAIWDDNDYGLNDGGASFLHKQSSKEAFMAFWQLPADDERRQREGLYVARTYGPPGQRVQVILLDGRWFRSPWKPTDQRNAPGKERYVPDANPALTMLGEAQWQWLEAQLRQPADVRLIASGIQVLAEGHGFERWGLFPHERQRLFDVIARTRAAGVVLLSGDRHIGAAYRMASGAPYALTDLTSSGITHTWTTANEPGPNRLGPLVTQLHYALIEMDWTSRSVLLALHGLDGTTLQSHRLRLSDLQPR